MDDPFQLADAYVDDLVALEPLSATRLGIPGSDHLWGDLGLDGEAQRDELHRRYRTRFAAGVDHPDPDQRVAALVMTQFLDRRIEAHDAGEHLRDLRHLASTFQRVVRIFDIMDTSNAAGFEAVSSRLETLDGALAQYRTRLMAGVDAGLAVAHRQVVSVIDQARRLAEAPSTFDGLIEEARAGDVDAQTIDRLEQAVRAGRRTMSEFAGFLRQDYLPHASERDGVGETRYRALAARFLGMTVEPEEAYDWGWDELARLIGEAGKVARRIMPDGDLDAVTSLLETDELRCAPSPAAFVDFIRQRQARALEELSGRHFEVDRRIREVSVDLAPAGTPLGAWYIGPSEDFDRPGSIWYSLGDQREIPLFHHVSTAYHEGFPGHHLQVGTARVSADRISRAQRLLVWYPGFGEGWAMYAERLMGELGYLEKDDYVFGMLAKQLYRAVRVVVDIGLHLELQIPQHAPLGGGERWTISRAEEYLRRFGFRTPAQATGEVLRYLGWPGQAISYKLGEREILRVRAEAQRRLGGSFDLTRFHSAVLGHGTLPLDLLPDLVLQS